MEVHDKIPKGNTSDIKTNDSEDIIHDTNESHEYKMKLDHCKYIRRNDSNEVLLVCNIEINFMTM